MVIMIDASSCYMPERMCCVNLLRMSESERRQTISHIFLNLFFTLLKKNIAFMTQIFGLGSCLPKMLYIRTGPCKLRSNMQQE